MDDIFAPIPLEVPFPLRQVTQNLRIRQVLQMMHILPLESYPAEVLENIVDWQTRHLATQIAMLTPLAKPFAKGMVDGVR